jgi:hypothetical protein
MVYSSLQARQVTMSHGSQTYVTITNREPNGGTGRVSAWVISVPQPEHTTVGNLSAATLVATGPVTCELMVLPSLDDGDHYKRAAACTVDTRPCSEFCLPVFMSRTPSYGFCQEVPIA